MLKLTKISKLCLREVFPKEYFSDFTLMYNFKLKKRSLKKKLQKSSVNMLKGVYNTGLQFLKFFQVPGK